MATRQGLCINCDYQAGCGYNRPPSLAVVHCEEHSTAASPEVHNRPARSVDSADDKETVIDPEDKGLCVNCTNRSTCKIARPIGGVWYCNEYQ
ncbi:MAG: hypothetical protein ACOWWM_14695 [Desulfobacterales bacterium]